MQIYLCPDPPSPLAPWSSECAPAKVANEVAVADTTMDEVSKAQVDLCSPLASADQPAEVNNPTAHNSEHRKPIIDLIKSAGDLATEFIGDADGFACELKVLAHAVQTLLDFIQARVGADAVSALDLTGAPSAVSQEVQGNNCVIERLRQYFALTLALSIADASSTSAALPTEQAPHSPDYMKDLTAFTKLHLQATGATDFLRLSCATDVADQSILASFSLGVGAFINKVGVSLYNSHSESFMQRATNIIMCARPHFQPGLVHIQVLERKEVDQILPLLLLNCDLRAHAPKDKLNLDGTPSDENELRSGAQYSELMGFKEFCEVAAVQEVGVPGVFDSNGAPVKLHLSDALTMMEAMTFAGELVKLNAALHIGFLQGTASVLKGDAFGYWTFVLALLLKSLSSFESMLSSEAALSVENTGVVIPLPVALLRNWRESMAIFSGKALKALLKCWASLLHQAVDHTKSLTPSWRVAVVDDKFEVPLAERVLCNRLPPPGEEPQRASQLVASDLGSSGESGTHSGNRNLEFVATRPRALSAFRTRILCGRRQAHANMHMGRRFRGNTYPVVPTPTMGGGERGNTEHVCLAKR